MLMISVFLGLSSSFLFLSLLSDDVSRPPTKFVRRGSGKNTCLEYGTCTTHVTITLEDLVG